MRPQRFFGLALTAAAASILIACTIEPSGLTPRSQGPPSVVGDRRNSWMSPEAKKSDLLYVVQSKTDIYVYSYPKGRLEGDIGGLDVPSGACVDKAGDVFVTDYNLREILEYPHGATKPSRTFDDSAFYPDDCSINPVNGELAVANYTSYGSAPGNVAIYKPPLREPKTYFNDVHIQNMASCTYDEHGNLYVGGLQPYVGYRYGILRAGKHFIISLGGISGAADPGAMHWDGKYLALAERLKGEILQYKISRQTALKVGDTKLSGAKNFEYFWIQHPNVIAPITSQSVVGVFKYPAGGSPFKRITTTYHGGALAVSLAK